MSLLRENPKYFFDKFFTLKKRKLKIHFINFRFRSLHSINYCCCSLVVIRKFNQRRRTMRDAFWAIRFSHRIYAMSKVNERECDSKNSSNLMIFHYLLSLFVVVGSTKENLSVFRSATPYNFEINQKFRIGVCVEILTVINLNFCNWNKYSKLKRSPSIYECHEIFYISLFGNILKFNGKLPFAMPPRIFLPVIKMSLLFFAKFIPR